VLRYGPGATTILIKCAGPDKLQCRWELPGHLLVVEPKAEKMTLTSSLSFVYVEVHVAITVSFAAVENGEVVDEAHVALLGGEVELVFLRNEMYSVKRFGLCFCETWNALGSRGNGMAREHAAGEINQGLFIVVVE
jgi:hypothetical protein